MRILFATILLLIISIAHSTPQQQEKKHQDEIIAKVNGVPIYKNELDASVAQRFDKQNKFRMQTTNTSPNITYVINMQALDDLINSEVLYQASRAEKDLPDVEDKVEQQIRHLVKTFGGEEDYETFLKTKNTSVKEKRTYFRESYLVQAYFDKIGLTKPDIPEEDIKSLYEQQKSSFWNPEEVKLSQVFINIGDNASPEEKKKAEKQAQEAKQLLFDGKSFNDVVKELSEKSELEVSGGYRGYIKKGVLPKEVDNIAFSIMPWKISNVIKSKFGYHVLMIEDKKPGEFTPYEEMRDFFLKYLKTEAVEKNIAAHIQELRGKAKIEILLKDPKNADNRTSAENQDKTGG